MTAKYWLKEFGHAFYTVSIAEKIYFFDIQFYLFKAYSHHDVWGLLFQDSLM